MIKIKIQHMDRDVISLYEACKKDDNLRNILNITLQKSIQENPNILTTKYAILKDDQIEKLHDTAIHSVDKAVEELRDMYNCWKEDAEECIETILKNYDKEKINKIKKVFKENKNG